MKRYANGMIIGLALCAVTSLPAFAGYDAGVRAYRQGDYATAMREFKADDGASAKFYLSLMYDKGDGVPQDREKSVALLRAAAEQGLDVAQANLGLMYCTGYIVKQDMAEGLKWLRKAAEQGVEEAQTVLMLASARD